MSYWRWRLLTQEPRERPKVEVQPIWSVRRGGEMRWPLMIRCVTCEHEHSYMQRTNWHHNQSDCPQCGQRGCFL
jgi:hypothetical protein